MGSPLTEVTRSQWQALVTKHKTAIRIGKAIGYHKNTVYRYLKAFDIYIERGPKIGAVYGSGKLRHWLGHHPESFSLPMTELALQSGVTYNAVKCYQYRLRRKARQVIMRTPWRHNGQPVIHIAVDGSRIPDRAFDVVRAFISRWGNVRLEVRLKHGGQCTIRLTATDLYEMYK